MTPQPKQVDTPTIKYNHPLLHEAVARGFVPGAKYMSLSGETRIVSEHGDLYFDNFYNEIVVGGFIIARKMDTRLDDRPQFYAWCEVIPEFEAVPVREVRFPGAKDEHERGVLVAQATKLTPASFEEWLQNPSL